MIPLASDIPLRGMVRDLPGSRLAIGQASDLLNSWRERGELRTRPGASAFRTRPATATGPVQNLFLAEFGDGSRSLLRFDEDAAYNDSGSAWTEIVPGAPPFWTGSSLAPFGIATVLNEVIAANGVAADGVKRWPGTGDFATIPNAGVLVDHDSFRFVTPFASRVIGAYTTGTNGANHVVGSAIGSTTDWTIRNGAFAQVRNEHSSPITGLTSDDNTLVVWKERAIVTGVETGDDMTPIFWQLLHTEGIGAMTHRLIASYGGTYYTLSHEGFISMSASEIAFIDTDIKRDFFSRLNFANLRQAHALAMPEFATIIFFIPEGSDAYPRNAWVYSILTGGWERWSLGLSVSAAVRTYASIGAVIDAYGGEGAIADITGGNALIDTGLISDLYIDQVGTDPSAAVYLLGDAAGETYALDFGADDDDGTDFPLNWETPDVRFEGLEDPETGLVIGPREVVLIDGITLEYNHSGANMTLAVSVSVDGGLTFASIGSIALTSTSSLYTRADIHCRVSGNQIRVRFSAPAVSGFPRFRNLVIWGQSAGERR